MHPETRYKLHISWKSCSGYTCGAFILRNFGNISVKFFVLEGPIPLLHWWGEIWHVEVHAKCHPHQCNVSPVGRKTSKLHFE